MRFPVADLHCDLLSFMAKVPKADPFDPDQIACAFPWLKAGGVRAQVLAIYTDVNPESMELASRQASNLAIASVGRMPKPKAPE